jgi:putative addiction module CopG family antidote
MRISLGGELERFVQSQVKKGQYASADDVVRDALQALKDQEDWVERHADLLKKQVKVGLSELDRGLGEPWDPEEIKAEGRRILAARTTTRRANRRKPR